MIGTCSLTAQVGIGTTNPNANAVLDITSTTQGVAFPRMNTSQRTNITLPAQGLVVFDTDLDCLMVNRGNATHDWQCLGASTLEIIGYDAATGGPTAVTAVQIAAISGITGVDNAQEANYQAYINANTGSFSSPATVLQVQAMIDFFNTPPITMPTSITLAKASTYMIASVLDSDYLPYMPPTVNATTATLQMADGSPDTSINIQGRITTTGTQIMLPVTTTASGTLPKFSHWINIHANKTQDGITRSIELSWPMTSYTASTTSIAVTIKSIGGSLNAKKLDIQTGIGANGLGVWMGTFTYPYNNAGSTYNLQVRAIAGIPDRNFANANHKFLYLPVTSTTGKTWLNNNLGVNYSNINHAKFNISKQATAIRDFNAYGSLFQWGRYSDGHELINWVSGIASDGEEQKAYREELGWSSTITPVAPNHDDFYYGQADWLNPSRNDLWQVSNGINNPCPADFRLPTSSELNQERLSWSANNSTGAIDSPLKLPAAGYRQGTQGSLTSTGSKGYYRSNTTNTANSAFLLLFTTTSPSPNASISSGNRQWGASVRCIMN